MRTEEARSKIKMLQCQIFGLEFEIDEVADSAMEETGIKVPHVSPLDNKPVDGLYDDAQWLRVSSSWDCEKSPFGLCAYHIVRDPHREGCVFCGEPSDRK